jgi:hypothetical protein
MQCAWYTAGLWRYVLLSKPEETRAESLYGCRSFFKLLRTAVLLLPISCAFCSPLPGKDFFAVVAVVTELAVVVVVAAFFLTFFVAAAAAGLGVTETVVAAVGLFLNFLVGGSADLGGVMEVLLLLLRAESEEKRGRK